MPFVKGQSGNPSGRPLSSQHRDFINWCKEMAVKKVQGKIEKFIDSNNPEFQRWASEIILERAFGKPIQYNYNENIDLNGEGQITDQQLQEELRKIANNVQPSAVRPSEGDQSSPRLSGTA